MKFAIKAQSSIATPQDIRLAYMQQTMLPLGNINGSIDVTHAWQLESQIPMAMTLSLPFYLRASIFFFVGCLALFLFPNNKKNEKMDMLSSPLTPTNKESPNVSDHKEFKSSSKLDGIIVVDCDPLRPRGDSVKSKNKLVSRFTRLVKKDDNSSLNESSKKSSQRSKNVLVDTASSELDKSQLHYYSPPETSVKTYDEKSNSIPRVITGQQHQYSDASKVMEVDGDNSTIATNVTGQQQDLIQFTEPVKEVHAESSLEGQNLPSNTRSSNYHDDKSTVTESSKKRGIFRHAKSLKKKLMNPLAKIPVGEKSVEVQQLSDQVEPHADSQGQQLNNLQSSTGAELSAAFKNDFFLLHNDNVSVNKNQPYEIRKSHSFRKTVEDVKSPLDEEASDTKESSPESFDVNVFLGEKPQTFDSTGMERTSVSKFEGNNKYLYSD